MPRYWKIYEHPTPASISQKNQRRRFSEFSNETLAVMASLGVHGASLRARMLRGNHEGRRLLVCGGLLQCLAKMNLHLEGGTSLHKLPYQAIIAGAWALGVVLIPLGVFQKDLAIWFAIEHVGVDLTTYGRNRHGLEGGHLDVAVDGADHWHVVFCAAGAATQR